VVKSALSISSPFSTIFTTVPFFIAGGAGVMFTQAIGRGDRQRAYEIFKTGLFIVIALALLSTLIILLIAKPLLTVLAGPAVKLNTPGHQTGDMEIMQAYYNQVHNTEIDFAYRYVFVLGSAMIMPMLIFYFSSLIKSEGRFKIVALFSVFCNLCNILADYVMVMFAHDGMRGGGIASVECYAINIILLAVYLFYLNSKNKTWLKFHALIPFSKKVRARGFFIRPIVLIGLAALMIDLSYSISMMFFIPILAHLSTIYPPPGAQGATYFQTISGAVMPIINLSFMTVYGIVEGERIVVSYNYAIGN
jgi:Na+-driven multidrug efflux pump